MSKAQITGFMLLGILLMSAFGFVIFVTNAAAKDRLQDSMSKLSGDILSTTVAETYITQCFDDAVEDGLELIGLQGGIIYENQTKGLPRFGLEDYSEYYLEYFYPPEKGVYYLPLDTRINYGINQNGLEKPNDKYGYYSASGIRKYDVIKNFAQFFSPELMGNVKGYPGACDELGLNKRTSRRMACSDYSYSLINSQQMLERYIENKTTDCLDLALMKEKFGYDIRTIENATVVVMYREKDVLVTLEYPLSIQIKSGDYSLKKLHFKKNYKVRLKKILESAYYLARTDVGDINFDIFKDYKKVEVGVAPFDPSFKVSITTPCKGSCPLDFGKYDDVVTILDPQSMLKGQDYSFRFAVKNRHPYLSAIQTVSEESIWHEKGYDIVVLEGADLKIKPIAIDPDGDDITFNYSGWLETQNETWQPAGENCVDFPRSCVHINPDIDQKYWSTNAEADGSVSFLTSHSDVGPHNLFLEIRDEEKKDWQNISIMVWPLPRLKAKLGSIYGLDDKYASIEDPYILDSSGSSVQMVIDPQYKWEIKSDTDSFIREKEIQSDFIIIPSNPDIKNIKKDYFKPRMTSYTPTTFYDKYNISLVFNDDMPFIYDPLLIENVRVYECLPHNAPYASYPYIDVISSSSSPLSYDVLTQNSRYRDFQGNHSCCSGEATSYGTVKHSSVDCYSIEYKTCNPFDETNIYPSNMALEYDNSNEEFVSYSNNIIPSGDIVSDDTLDSANDIYVRKYVQKCDGTRGNICGGAVTDKYSSEQSLACADNTGVRNLGRCSGPCNPYIGCNVHTCPGDEGSLFSLGDNPTCYNYSLGDTFEKDFLEITIDGHCGDFAPSTKDDYNVPGGIFSCKGFCDGQGGCTIRDSCVCARGNRCDGYVAGFSFSDGKFCSVDCDVLDPDDLINACRSVGGSYIINGECCENDAYENVIFSSSGVKSCCHNNRNCVDSIGSCGCMTTNGICDSSDISCISY